jgi:HlyD family secretion protein
MVRGCLLTILLLAAALVSCNPAPTPAPTPVPVATEMHEESRIHLNGDTVVASGEVRPAQEARLSFTMSGQVQTMAVMEGEEVQEGMVLVALETDRLEAEVTQAEAALAAAQAQQALLEAGPRPGETAAAEARVEAGEAALAQAAARRDQLASGVKEAEIAAARAQLAAARAEEKAAREAYDDAQDRKVEDWEEKTALLRLRAAELSRAAAEARVAQAEESAQIRVRAAQAAAWTAAAERDAAQAQLDLLQAGATDEEITAAEAGAAQAEATLQAARAALDQATLHAPFAGTVTALEISPGEAVVPDQAVLTLADLHHLRVETTDLSERDVVRVAVGRQAIAHVEALDVDIEGWVAEIAPQAMTVGGDVVYAVVVELEEQPPGLRWGMSAEVEIATE